MTKVFLGIIAALTIALGLLGWYTKNLHANYITEKNNSITLTTVKEELEQKMEEANAASKEFQNRLSAVDKQLSARRLRDDKTSDCVVIDTGERGSNAATSGEIIPDRDGRSGLSIDWLYDFAGRCEKTRQKTIGLQRFIRAVND